MYAENSARGETTDTAREEGETIETAGGKGETTETADEICQFAVIAIIMFCTL